MEEIDKEQLKLNYKALDKIGQYLSRRDHSEYELRQKLAAKFSPSSIDWAISEAFEQKWIINPEELAQKVSEELQRRRKGSLYINNYLRKKGLPTVTINDDDQLTTARELTEHKFGDLSELDFKEKQKIGRFLLSRGFDNQTVKKVIYE